MASADGRRAIRNAAYRLTFPLTDASGQVVSASASLDSEYSLDGNTFADCASEATEIGTSGVYYLDLDASEMSGDTVAVKVASASANTYVEVIDLEPALDSGVAQAATSTSLTLRSAASSVDDFYNGATLEIAKGTGAGQVRTVTDYTGSSTVATIDRAWITNPDTTSAYILHPAVGIKHGTDIVAATNAVQISGSATAADNMESLYDDGLVASSVSDGSPTTTSFTTAAGLSTTADFYNTAMLHFTEGVNKGLTRQIIDYSYAASTSTITLGTALPTEPADGDNFVIFGKVF